jgi:hypothetical protein
MTVPKIYRHERGPEYDSLNAWKNSMDQSIQKLANVMLASATGSAEKSLHGAATIGYDGATLIRLDAAVGLIREALRNSRGNWLRPIQQTQARLPAARADERLQAFLKCIDDGEFSNRGGAQ